MLFIFVGVNITFSGVTTFRNCLDFGVGQQIELLTTISDAANKEYSVEQTLDKMMKEWENCKMELNPFKETGTYIVKISDDIQQMLDDHLILTQQISFSPFKSPFAEKIDKWEEKLKITSEVIEEWMDVQK